MSYLGEHYELYKEDIEKERMAKEIKDRLRNELSYNDMIKLMFSYFIKSKGVSETIEIGKEYLVNCD